MKKEAAKSAFYEVIVDVRRVVKVVKGGRIFSFSVLAVIGDKAGSFGIGTGKALDVSDAKKKAINSAKRTITRVNLRNGRTINHISFASCGSTSVMLRPAKPGTGVVAGGSCRTLLEAIGIHDVVAKINGSSNVHTTLLATASALGKIQSIKSIAALRSKKTKEVIAHTKRMSDEKSSEEKDIDSSDVA